MTRTPILLGFASLLTAISAAEPVVVAYDPFTDGQLAPTPNGDELGLVWFQNEQALRVVDGDAGLGDGMAMHFKPTQDFGRFTTHFPAVKLASEGDTLSVEFDYLLPLGLPKIANGLRMGLYDSNATPREKDTDLSSCNDDAGYGVSSNAGGGGSRGSQCFREAAGDNVLGGPGQTGIVFIGDRGPCLPADAMRHHLRFSIQKTVDAGLVITWAVDDLELTSATDSADLVLTSQFDEFALGFGGKDNLGEITVDNFKVTASTQQPLASMAPKPKPVEISAFRQWTNQQGRQIEASLMAYDANTKTVKVAMRDGREFVLPLSTLSAEDNDFVTQAEAALPVAASTPAAWVVQYPEPLKKAGAKLESGRALLRNLRSGHPRLMMLEEDWGALKELVSSDPIAGKLFTAVQTAGVGYLSAPPLEHVLPDGVRLLGTSREFVARIYVLGLLHRLDGDPKWSARAIKEMLNICAFEDWNPSHFLDVAEMAHGMAVGYDWFFNQLDDSARAQVRRAIVEKAFTPALAVYAKPTGWHRGEHLNNWNHVCNGGLIVAALAVADEEKRESAQILDAAMSSLEPAMNLYLPDGAWDEGPGYWEYATSYVTTCSEALRTATGSDGGISSAPAFDKTADFMQHVSGASGKSFDFGDGHPIDWNRAAFMWMGRRFQRPDYASMIKSHLEKFNPSSKDLWFGAAHALLWFDRKAGAKEWQQAPCDRVFRRIELVTLRSSWEPDAWSISAKGGDNRFSHGNLDLGTFVLDALGVRWGMDLGADNYGLEGYFGKERFTHYRTSSAGQNVLTWDDQNQERDGTGFVETFESTPNKSWAVLNLSKGYQTAKQVRRGILLTRGDSPSALVQDEIVKPGRGTLVWAMHTKAQTKISGKTAVFERDNKQIVATILEPADAVFQVQDINLEPPAHPTTDTRKLMIKLPSSKDAITIAVAFTQADGAPAALPIVPLAQWGGKTVPR